MNYRFTLLAAALIFVGLLMWMKPPGKEFRASAQGSNAVQHAPSIQEQSTQPPSPRAQPHFTEAHTYLAKSNPPPGSIVFEEIRRFDDPAAEDLVNVLAQAGWPQVDQLRRFKEAYDQLGNIYTFNDLISQNRNDMRLQFESLETNQLYSAEMRREARRQYMILQNTFDATIQQKQTETMSNLLIFLGPPPNMDQDELRRRLLDVHPRMPLHGNVTNFLGQAVPAL